MAEISMLSTLDPHHRIVAYLGASYRPHPIFKEEHLFIITEYMEGVSIMTLAVVDLSLPSYTYTHTHTVRAHYVTLSAQKRD